MMNDEKLWLRFQRELKTPSTTFRYPSNLLHLRNALLSHPKISKFAPSAQPQLFIIHFSSFIIHYLRRQPRHSHHHRHSSLSLAPHYQKSKSAPQVKQGCFNSGRTKSLHGRSDTNDRRRNHNSSFFIIHYSSFILHFPPSPAAPRSPSRSPPRRPASFFRPIHTRTCS